MYRTRTRDSSAERRCLIHQQDQDQEEEEEEEPQQQWQEEEENANFLVHVPCRSGEWNTHATAR
jgi:hypothetical protein